MNKPKQQTMFQTEDLPLFSGTAPTVKDEKFTPTPVVKQLTLEESKSNDPTNHCPSL